MLEELKMDIKDRMSKAVRITEEELAGIRTGGLPHPSSKI